MAKYDEFGREVNDEPPVEWPIGVSVPETLEQKMHRMIRTSMSEMAARSGQETFEEADDFDVEDEEDRVSDHELDDDQERVMGELQQMRRIPREYRERFAELERGRRARQEVKKEPAVAGEQKSSEEGKVPPT